MAIKDLFNNFFEFTDEEEVVEEPEQYREKESQNQHNHVHHKQHSQI